MNRGGERSHDPGRRSATLLFWGWQTRTARSGQQAHGPEQGVAAEQEWSKSYYPIMISAMSAARG